MCHFITSIVAAIATVFTMAIVAPPVLRAQVFKVIYDFPGGQGGAGPAAGVTMNVGGNLYGTTSSGGAGNGYGTAYKLTHKNGNWISAPLYQFAGGNDGSIPLARVVIGSNGSIYGTTYSGGVGCQGNGCGTVFNLKPTPTRPPTPLTPWVEAVLYRFQGPPGDGSSPGEGDLVFDKAGNLYGTTINGGANNEGTIFALTPSQGGWTEKLIYSFTGISDGGLPASGVVFDGAGNLYGTASGLCTNLGVIYELTPSGSGWVEQTLYAFKGSDDGWCPAGGLIFDQSGNLYGTTAEGGTGGGGTVYELSPSNGSWTLTTLYSFSGNGGLQGPAASLTMDASGNLYGTTYGDGSNGYGNVFKLTPSGGTWMYTSLHDFTGGNDGGSPVSDVTLDANGNLYGTAGHGGSQGNGVVWEITP
jgi:uncharacterized repeat protein (TIGR03803 family)